MKRWISLSLCFLLCLGLIIPALLVVPVSAEITASGKDGNVSWSIDDGVLNFTGTGSTSNKSEYNVHSFYNMELSGLVISSTVTGLGNYTFNKNTFTNDIEIPATVTTVGTQLFWTCSMKDIYYNASTLSGAGFMNCVFDNLYLSDNITSMSKSNYFNGAVGRVHLPSNPPSLSSTALSGSSGIIFLVPYGSLSSYLGNSSWAAYASRITEEDPPAPSVPTLVTSFDGQVINVDVGGVNFYIHASNVNGDLSCEWYINGELYEEVFDFVEVEDGVWIQGWRYTATGEGIREIYAIVKNSLGDQVASISTGTAILNVGNVGSGGGGSGDSGSGDSGSNTEVIEKLETLDLGISNIQSSVDNLTENVEQLPDEIKDGMEQLQEQEKQEANSTGDSSAQEVIQIIPNPSDDFLPAFRNLVSVMSYDGTAAVLSIPEVSIPQIGNIVPNIKLLDSQEIDLAYYVTLIPEILLNFIRALFDSALVIYCLYELFTMIGSALTGFSNMVGKEDLHE